MDSGFFEYILGYPENPQLTMPENIYENQAMTLICSGNVGRNEDGSPVATLGFEALQKVTFRFVNNRNYSNIDITTASAAATATTTTTTTTGNCKIGHFP